LLTSALLLLTLVFFVKYRQRSREREKLQKETMQMKYDLEGKSRELLAESLNNLTAQNTREEILGDLEVILNQLPEKSRKQFSGLVYKLVSGRDSKFLEEFEQRFTGVYESFYQKIMDLAPNLSPNELKVCAFIRLNITTKDIARLTGKSLGTVENTRISIRKKLNLNSDDNLQQFLLTL
jgi:DNA-binding CsgD family transcriptional regulator